MGEQGVGNASDASEEATDVVEERCVPDSDEEEAEEVEDEEDEESDAVDTRREAGGDDVANFATGGRITMPGRRVGEGDARPARNGAHCIVLSGSFLGEQGGFGSGRTRPRGVEVEAVAMGDMMISRGVMGVTVRRE
jgi:hypothetical protein